MKKGSCKRDASVPAHRPRKEKGLIESSFPEAFDMERNGNEELQRIRLPEARKPLGHPSPQQGGEVEPPLVLPAVNDLLKGTHIVSQGSGRGKVARPGPAGAARMEASFRGNKWNATDGTEGGLNPANS